MQDKRTERKIIFYDGKASLPAQSSSVSTQESQYSTSHSDDRLAAF